MQRVNILRRFAPSCCLHLLLALLLAAAPAWTATAGLPADPVSGQYAKARETFQGLQQNAQGLDRNNWLACAESFRILARTHPRHDIGPRALFMLARTYHEMSRRFANPPDLGEASSVYEDVATLFPDHFLADDALFALASLLAREQNEPERAGRIYARIVALYPHGDMAAAAASELTRLKAMGPTDPASATARIPDPAKTITPGAVKTAKTQNPPDKNGGIARAPLATVLPIRHWSSNRYTRVVVQTSEPVAFRHNLLEGNQEQPRRLYIDLSNSRLGPDMAGAIPIEDGLLRRVRSGQFDPTTVRVVLDTQTTITDYKVFSLENPFRVVIDVKSQEGQKSRNGSDEKSAPPAGRNGAGIKKIVIDPGHGGKDPGAISPSGLKEKDIVLQVALLVAARLRENPSYKVILTRDRDIFVPLEERTAIANANEADIFLSIHVNAAPNRQARGIETYVLNLTNDQEAMRLAALENASSAKQINQLQSILLDLMHNSKLTESVKLAEIVQEEMVSGLGRIQPGINNLGVKKAPFVVLIGAQMPAILTEVGFLSNENEEARLRNSQYLADLAIHITAGVSRYADNLSLAANFFR
jgi:N-acetylmuramoyl-L-alanine amidase